MSPDALAASREPVVVADTPAGVVAIALGPAHVCVATDAEVWCWGANDAGQLGSSDAAARWRAGREGGSRPGAPSFCTSTTRAAGRSSRTR